VHSDFHLFRLLRCQQPAEKAKNSPFKRWQRQSCLIGSLALAFGLGWGKAVRAEGSVDLTNNQGYRPFLEYRNDPTANILRRTIIRVFAQAGESIDLGSSALAFGIGGGAGDIRFTAPDNTTNLCSTVAPNTGFIGTRTAELGGSTGGYTPCTVPVGANQTGIWTIEFISPNPNSTVDPPLTLVNTNWVQPTNVGYVAAWDVTVRNGNTPIPGRAYANYLALNMGGNRPGEQVLRSNAFILTDIGYLYQVDLNGIDPFGFIFFANSKGFTTQPCGQGGVPLYASVPLVATPNNPSFTPPNVCIPSIPDNPGTNDITYKIFFNSPAQDLPSSAQLAGGGTTWLLNPPQPSTNISDFIFVGQEGTPNQAGSPLLGGNFIFTATGFGNYVITIDVNRDGVLGNANDRVLQGSTEIIGTHTVTVPWDGLDANGQPLTAGTTPYTSELSFFVGDVHFPFLDPENNPAGLIIRNVTTGNSRVYYNDSPIQVDNTGTPPTPITALGGVDSTPGVHTFSNNFGDNKGIDTWTSLANPLLLSGGILIQKADPTIQKSVSANPVSAGGPVSYTLTVTSNPPPQGDVYTNLKGITVTDTVPAGVTGVSWTCAITSGIGACGTPSGTGNNIDLTVDLNVGATATITVNGTVAASTTGTLSNTATVARPLDVTDANEDNNTASAETTVAPNPVQPTGTKSVRLFADTDSSGSLTTGDVIEYAIAYSNTQPDLDILNFQVTDLLESENLRFVRGSYSFTASGTGTTVGANPNYNGTTDINLTTPGTLGREGGQIVITYRAVVIAAAGTTVSNQASATSTNGTVNPSITDASAGSGDIPQIADDGINQGNLANTGDDEPTLFVVVDASGAPRLRLVKRITNLTRGGVPLAGINLSSFVDDPNDDNDNAPGWSQLPGGAPVGAINLGSETTAQSGDEVEYTVYFLSDGSQGVQDAKVCDPIPAGTTFIPDSFSAGRGILVNQGGTSTPQTNASDTDKGTFFGLLTPVTAPCAAPNNPTGAVFLQLDDLPNISPSNVGFIRFRVKVD